MRIFGETEYYLEIGKMITNSKRSWNLMNESKNMSIEEQKLRQKIRRLIDEVVTPPTTTPDIPADVPSPGTAGPSMPEPTALSPTHDTHTTPHNDVDEMERRCTKSGFDEAAKPDFLDLDGDKDKDEPMEKAAKEVEEGKGTRLCQPCQREPIRPRRPMY
jgi:hypothetical protein